MTVLASHVVREDAFSRRSARMDELVAELRERTALVAAGGGEASVERHRSRGKLPARERIDRLVDPGSWFEIGVMAGKGEYDKDGNLLNVRPSNAIIGTARIDGRKVSLDVDEDTARRMAKGTVGIRIRVTRFDARAKLSQNKAPGVVDDIVAGLRGDGPYASPALADEIERVRSAAGDDQGGREAE